MSKPESAISGVGILDVVQIVFIILKLCGVINWSWWVVLLPLLVTLAIGGVVIVWALLDS